MKNSAVAKSNFTSIKMPAERSPIGRRPIVVRSPAVRGGSFPAVTRARGDNLQTPAIRGDSLWSLSTRPIVLLSLLIIPLTHGASFVSEIDDDSKWSIDRDSDWSLDNDSDWSIDNNYDRSHHQNTKLSSSVMVSDSPACPQRSLDVSRDCAKVRRHVIFTSRHF